MKKISFVLVVCMGAPLAAWAAPVLDATGDFLATHAGPANADLDVVSSEVTFNNVANTFTITGTMAGPLGQTAGAGYAWGFNRGAGTEGFQAANPPIGDGVLFDSILVLRPDATGTFISLTGGGNTQLPAGSVTVLGSTITATNLPLAMFPSAGFSAANYTWNLWPRSGPGNVGIPDFAPDASNAPVTVVPEPASIGMVLLAGLALARRP